MPSVLIIDSNPILRAIARDVLEAASVVCIEAADPAKAVELVRISGPDAVLLELDEATVDGISTARAIKAERPETKVVLLTSHDEEAYLSATGKTGSDAFLPKRALRSDLIGTLRRLGREFSQIWDGSERRGRALRAALPWDGREQRRPARRDAPERVDGPHFQPRRVPLLRRCQVQGPSLEAVGILCNLSVRGTFVAIQPVPKIGEQVLLSFQLPWQQKPMAIDAVVAWDNTARKAQGLPPGCGLEFLDPARDDLLQIEAAVRTFASRI